VASEAWKAIDCPDLIAAFKEDLLGQDVDTTGNGISEKWGCARDNVEKEMVLEC
jgi:hypothetical protein